jgi:hypothetical protein
VLRGKTEVRWSRCGLLEALYQDSHPSAASALLGRQRIRRAIDPTAPPPKKPQAAGLCLETSSPRSVFRRRRAHRFIPSASRRTPRPGAPDQLRAVLASCITFTR